MSRAMPAEWIVAVVLAWALPVAAQRAEFREADSDAVDPPAARKGVPDAGGESRKADVSKVAARIVEMTNSFRSGESRERVKSNAELHAAARYFADYMARTGRYGHTADGRQPSGRAERHGYDFCLVAENIAYAHNSAGYGTEDLAKEFTQGWINSPGHRQNMIEPDVVETGVAVSRSDSGVYYAVQMFGRPKSLEVQFRLVNRAGRAVTYTVGNERYNLLPRVTRTHTRCRPSTLSFNLSSTEGGVGQLKRSEGFKPRDGDVYVVAEKQGGGLDVRRE